MTPPVAYDPVKTVLSESEAEAEEPTNQNASFQALRLQPNNEKMLTTPTMQISLDHKDL